MCSEALYQKKYRVASLIEKIALALKDEYTVDMRYLLPRNLCLGFLNGTGSSCLIVLAGLLPSLSRKVLVRELSSRSVRLPLQPCHRSAFLYVYLGEVLRCKDLTEVIPL